MSTVNVLQPRLTWEDSLNEELATLGWPGNMSVDDCRMIVLRQRVMWEDSARCGWHYYLGRGSWTL